MNTPKERILLVENDPEISDLISRQTLQPLGYRVEVVGAAPAAIQEAVRFAPDVILANLNLPGLSGKDLLVALNSQGLEVPIIVIAPKDMQGDVIQAFRLGAADYLTWPVREAEVVSAVERVLKQVRARREREILARQLNQTNQELQRRVRELTTLFAIGKAVITATDQQALFNKIVEGGVFVAEADSGWLLVRDERSKTFLLKAARNVPNDIHARLNQPFDDGGLSSLVALSGESLSIHGDPLKRFVKIFRLGKAALVVPVKVKKEVFGLLVVIRKAAQPFGSGHQALLEAVADYASISLVNARLFSALEERVNSLQQSANNASAGERIQEEIIQQISQELRHPLMVIKGNVDMLLSNSMGKLNVEQSKAMEVIREKLKTVFEITDSLQELRKSPSPAEKTANLSELARQTVGRFQAIARQTAATLNLDLPSKPVLVRADASQIAKVLDGLISNAIKFSPQGGQITIKVIRSGEMAQLSVQDNGIGIEEKHLPHIFEPSYKIEGAPTGRYGGLGISLSLAKEIIAANGGKLWAESTPGQGSTFHFTLPAA